MNIILTKNKEEAGKAISDSIIQAIKIKPDLLFCAATGSSPTETYNTLSKSSDLFPTKQLRILKLDEWGGIPMEDPDSCEQYLQKHLIQPLKVKPEKYFGFQSNSQNPPAEINRIQKILLKEGPIDICILGIGMNGHLALNEPAKYLTPGCHIAALTETTLTHPMATAMNTPPTYGLTLGMGDILSSKHIILIIQGAHKKAITEVLMQKKITSFNPASFLWTHQNVDCFVDEEAIPFMKKHGIN